MNSPASWPIPRATCREREERLAEHEVRERDAGERAGQLGDDVGKDVPPGRPPWLASATVTAGLKCAPEIPPKVRIERHQARAGRERVREERERDVSAREALAHDAGADDGREEEGGSDALGDDAPAKGRRPSRRGRRANGSRVTSALADADGGQQAAASSE